MSSSDPITTVAEAVVYLLSTLDADTRAALMAINRDETISLHRDYGMRVRAALGLWGGNRALMADPDIAGMFPDDASDVLIKRVWDALHAAQD